MVRVPLADVSRFAVAARVARGKVSRENDAAKMEERKGHGERSEPCPFRVAAGTHVICTKTGLFSRFSR